MEKIIASVDKGTLKKELHNSLFVRTTNFDNNEIYIFNAHQCPELMNEVGRLREVSFRDSGGGSGKSMDVDEYDLMDNPYWQIIVWDPLEEEIVGGYRYFNLNDAIKEVDGRYKISTANMFKPSARFEKEFMPFTMELGKSFIQPKYQPVTNPRKGVFSLDNLWDGLGALIVDHPDTKYFYGRVTLYKNYHSKARDLLLHFMYKYFGDKENLIEVYEPESIRHNREQLDDFFNDEGYDADFSNLNQAIRDLGETIPPLIKAYMSLSPSMKVFGIAHNHDFGNNVEGIGILVTIDDIYPSKKRRHVQSYLKQKTEQKAL